MLKIYLAGPEVFLPDAMTVGAHRKALCLAYGFEGYFPLDNVISGDSPKEIASKIQAANKAMIQACDVVIANLSPFRGPEPDSGTVWEVGYAQGLGKKVIAYAEDRRTLKERTQDFLHLGNDALSDHNGMMLEDFGLSHNLMFASIVVAGSFEEALAYISVFLKQCE
jgi:nucleoside 2-deoxyribosyltransferase